MKAKDFSGAGWDEDLKMVIINEETHDDLKKARSKLAQWVNVPIKNFDLLRVVCGDDYARGDYVKDSSAKWGPHEYVDVDTPPTGALGGGASQSTKSSGGKRRRAQHEATGEYTQLYNCLTIMANALSTGFMTPIEKMGAKLFSIEGYECTVISAAYNFLCTDALEANKFIGLPESYQREWLDNFMQNM